MDWAIKIHRIFCLLLDHNLAVKTYEDDFLLLNYSQPCSQN
jgi:hypothetical protein